MSTSRQQEKLQQEHELVMDELRTKYKERIDLKPAGTVVVLAGSEERIIYLPLKLIHKAPGNFQHTCYFDLQNGLLDLRKYPVNVVEDMYHYLLAHSRNPQWVPRKGAWGLELLLLEELATDLSLTTLVTILAPIIEQQHRSDEASHIARSLSHHGTLSHRARSRYGL